MKTVLAAIDDPASGACGDSLVSVGRDGACGLSRHGYGLGVIVKGFVFALLFVLAALFLSWVGGFDFDRRGLDAFFVAVFAVCAAAVGWAFGSYK